MLTLTDGERRTTVETSFARGGAVGFGIDVVAATGVATGVGLLGGSSVAGPASIR
jgi:hypothetical protein